MFKTGDDVVFIKGESLYDKRVWKVKRLTKLKDQVLLSRPVGGRMWQPIELLRKATKEEMVLQKTGRSVNCRDGLIKVAY